MVSAAEQLAANLNFSALAKAEELKKRLWFTLGALLVYRLGTYIPLPGIDPSAWDQIFRSQAGGILGMFNMFSGGGIHRINGGHWKIHWRNWATSAVCSAIACQTVAFSSLTVICGATSTRSDSSPSSWSI